MNYYILLLKHGYPERYMGTLMALRGNHRITRVERRVATLQPMMVLEPAGLMIDKMEKLRVKYRLKVEPLTGNVFEKDLQ